MCFENKNKIKTPAVSRTAVHIGWHRLRNTILGRFGNDNGDGNKNVNDYARAAHFFVHFLPSPHDYDVKFPQATFYNYGGGKNNKTNFSFSF